MRNIIICITAQLKKINTFKKSPEYYHLYNSPEQKAVLQAQFTPKATNLSPHPKAVQAIKEAVQAPKEAKKPTKRHPPFTPNPIMGYQVQKGKAKIFLDRKASSKTLTLSLDDLKELVMAVEKAERI